MSKEPDSTTNRKGRKDYLDAWRQRDTLKSLNRSLDITYTSKPPILGQIVTVLATSEDEQIFTSLFNTLPPHDLMSVKLHGRGTTGEAVVIIKFLSEKIKAPVRMDMSANEDIFTEKEIQLLGPHLELIKYNPTLHADRPHLLDGAI